MRCSRWTVERRLGGGSPARELEIDGRSTMSKDELAEAVLERV